MANALDFLRRPVIIGVLVFAAILFLTQLFTYQRYVLVRTQKTRELTNAANVVKEKIEATLSNGMAAATTLNIMVQHYGVRDFDSIARHILELNEHIDGLSLVEGETVTHIYPLEGNEAYLGYNIFKDTVNNGELRTSLRNKDLYFAGPYELIQGGQGIISRMPIFKEGRYYGFATALIRLKTFLKAANLDSVYDPIYVFQVSGIDPETHKETFFLPHKESSAKQISVQVNVSEGPWVISAQFSKPVPLAPVYISVLIGVVFAAVAGLLGWYIAKLPANLKRLVAEKVRLLCASEAEYASLFEQANDAILVVDAQGSITDVNDSLCSMLQYSKSDLLQMKLEDILDPEELTRIPMTLDAVLKGALLFKDRRLIRNTGAVAEVELSAKKIGDNKILIIGRDVTDQRQVQQRIAMSESTLRSAFDYSPIGMCLISMAGKFLKINRNLTEMLGYSEEEFLGLDFKDIIHPDDRIAGLPQLARAQKDDPAMPGNEQRYICKDGSVIWINLIVSVVNGDKNEPLFYVCQIENITQVKRLARQLSERVKELQCLYDLSEVSTRSGKSIEEIIEAFIEKIPSAYQYADIACARITFNNRVFQTKHFTESIWKQEAPIVSDDHRVGSIEVFYTQEKEPEHEGPFVKEERYLINTISDILGNSAERKRAQNELTQSEEKFRSLVEQSLASVFIYQEDRFIYVNPAFEATSGYTREQLIDRMSLEHLVHDDDKAMLTDNYGFRLGGQSLSDHCMLRIIRSDGAVSHIEMVVSSIQYNDKLAVIGTIIDVTERMEEEQRIERAVTEAQEAERLQIGMELHDNVKQILAASRFRLVALVESLNQPEEARKIIDDLKANIVEAIHELRRLSHQLAPSVDPSRSLEDKIQSLANAMNATDTLDITIDIDESGECLKEEVQLALYRILQEQLVNILKYAEASRVEIGINANDHGVRMNIQDNGKGYDTNVKNVGIGLENIRRRAQFLNGKAEVISAQGRGCKLVVDIPASV